MNGEGSLTRCNPLVTLNNKRAKLDIRHKTKINLYQDYEKRKRKWLSIQSISDHLSSMVEVML